MSLLVFSPRSIGDVSRYPALSCETVVAFHRHLYGTGKIHTPDSLPVYSPVFLLFPVPVSGSAAGSVRIRCHPLCIHHTETGNFSILRTPWQYGKRRKSGLRYNSVSSSFANPFKEARSIVQRSSIAFSRQLTELRHFQGSEHIRKLQTDKLNAFFLHDLQNFCFSILLHNILSLSYTMILLYFSLTDLYTPSKNNRLLLQPVFLPGSPIRPATDLCAHLLLQIPPVHWSHTFLSFVATFVLASTDTPNASVTYFWLPVNLRRSVPD